MKYTFIVRRMYTFTLFELQIASPGNLSPRTVCQKLHKNCLSAAHKPKIPLRNTKHWLEWYKETCGVSCFTI